MRLYRNFLPNTSVSAPSGTRKNIPRLSPSKFLHHFAGTPWTLSCVRFQKTIQMQCRWFAASSEVAKTAFGHSQKHTAAIPLKVPSSLFAGTPWTLSCVWFQKTIQMQCRWFAASFEVAKTAFGHSQKHIAALLCISRLRRFFRRAPSLLRKRKRRRRRKHLTVTK